MNTIHIRRRTLAAMILSALWGCTFFVLFLISPHSACSQSAGKIPAGIKTEFKAGDVVDKIVAIVGNEIIMQSDVMMNAYMAANRDRRLNPSDPRLLKESLDMLINERLVMTKAIEDSLTASEDEITERMEFQLQSMRAQFGSDKRIEEVYNMPLVKIKREFRDEVRKQILTEKISQQKFASIKITPREVQEFYKQYRDSLPTVPAQYDLYHIVKFVEASQTAKERTLALAQKVRDSLVAAQGKFADFARRYSDDPGSKNSGGELGTVNRGNFIAEFEKAAYALQPSEISLPVESPFGYHIIQLIEKQENAINTRHILFSIGQTTEDGDRTKKLLDSLKQVIMKTDSGKGDAFEQYAKVFSDDTETKAFGGSLGRIELARLPTDLRERIEKLPDGGITEPALFNVPSSTKVAYHIVFKKKFVPEHAITLAEDYKRVEQMASSQKRARMYEAWMQELRKTIYWQMKN